MVALGSWGLGDPAFRCANDGAPEQTHGVFKPEEFGQYLTLPVTRFTRTRQVFSVSS